MSTVAAAAMLTLSGCSREASRLHTTAATTTAAGPFGQEVANQKAEGKRTATMDRCCFCRSAELHRGLGQSTQWLLENTRLGALEIRRTLHGLDVEISLGELGPLGGDTLAVGIGVEQDRCEAVGAA